MARRIGGRGGGSDKGSGVGTVVAAAMVIALGAGGAAGIGVSTGGFGASGSGASSASQGARATSRSSDSARIRLSARNVRVNIHVSDDSDDCVSHSSDDIQEFFRTHPCVAMYRALFEIRDSEGNIALVAAAWVEMADASSARELVRLLDIEFTGNITELSEERGRYRDIRWGGDAYKSVHDGAVVITAQAEPVLPRRWGGPKLTSLIEDVVYG
jgi:hypothetical protein